MKKLILLFFLCNLSIAYAQYWAPVGTTWHYERYYFNPDPVQTGFVKIQAVGDTLIEGITCQKLAVQNQMACYGRPDLEYTYYSNDTVYYYDTTYNAFQILYNFGANQGDSWQTVVTMNGMGNDTITTTVDSTGFITINGENLKLLYVTYSVDFSFQSNFQYSSVLIERIGDVNYMFNIMPELFYTCDESWSGGLRCYEDVTLGLYETGIASSCEYIAYLGLNKNSQSEINIFPNPTSGYFNITGIPKEDLIVTLKNSEGRIVLSTVGSDEIDVSVLEQGVYFVSMNYAGGIVVRKVVVD